MANNLILLHACCAICAGYPIEYLLAEGYRPIVFFSNNNIDTQEEFERRKNAMITLCQNFGVELLIDDYSPQQYIDVVLGLENEPERGARCDKCIAHRLRKTADKAIELGVSSFTTTLVISPHKDFTKITKIGDSLAKEYHLDYVGINFKKKDGFLKTNTIARNLNLYRQNYCGCKFAKGHLKEVCDGV